MVQQANPWWKSLPGASRRSCEDEEEQRRFKTFQVVPGGSGVLLGKRAGFTQLGYVAETRKHGAEQLGRSLLKSCPWSFLYRLEPKSGVTLDITMSTCCVDQAERSSLRSFSFHM